MFRPLVFVTARVARRVRRATAPDVSEGCPAERSRCCLRVHLPPLCKPLFHDLAFRYLEAVNDDDLRICKSNVLLHAACSNTLPAAAGCRPPVAAMQHGGGRRCAAGECTTPVPHARRVHCCAARTVPLRCSFAVRWPHTAAVRPVLALQPKRLPPAALWAIGLLTPALKGAAKVRAVLASSRKRLPCAAGGTSFSSPPCIFNLSPER